MAVQRFRCEVGCHHRRQGEQRRQGCPEVVGREAQLADMGRQRPFLAGGMLDGMRPRRQLGEEENGNEKELAQRIH